MASLEAREKSNLVPIEDEERVIQRERERRKAGAEKRNVEHRAASSPKGSGVRGRSREARRGARPFSPAPTHPDAGKKPHRGHLTQAVPAHPLSPELWKGRNAGGPPSPLCRDRSFPLTQFPPGFDKV